MRIFFDVDTQIDFMSREGALCVQGAESIIPNLEKLTDYARKNSIQVLGSVDRHFGIEKYKEREKELQRNGGPFPDHCMNRTRGLKKIPSTVVFWEWVDRSWQDELALYIPHPLAQDQSGEIDETEIGWALNNLDATVNKKWEPRGIYFEKQSYDIFTNPNLEEVLKRASVKEAIVYGVATDYCVKAAVLGMLGRGLKVYVVEDAIKGVTDEGSKEAIKEMKQKGAKFITTKQVLEDKLE